MIRIHEVTLRRGTKVLLKEATTSLNPGEKVGLIGANGAGKTSLFALLCGTLSSDAGDVNIPPNWRIAHVAQETAATPRSALDYVIDGDRHLRAIQAELEKLEQQHDAHHGERIAELHTQFADAQGYSVQARAETLLLGLGFSLADTLQAVGDFSGGWRMRLNLAQALMCPSDLLLLDEPTNHLDLDAIVWLEQWLRRYPGTVIIISHDREFLDAVCRVTLHIDQQNLKRYSGNYSAFEKLRAAQQQLDQAAYTKQQREIAHLQSFVDRFKAKASKAKQAQSRVKALERMELISPTYLQSSFSFRFGSAENAPDPMLVGENLLCGYLTENGPKPILSCQHLTLRTGERIGLLGANGQGKSTFIKTLAGVLAPLSGSFSTGKGLAIGYFAQHQVDALRLDQSPLQQLARIAPNTREQELRNYLGSFDFSHSMATSAVAPFSGGEKARLALALLIWNKPNLLLLDEPTNHLDLETREALTVALAQFEGTLVLVSHDRALLRATTDQFLLVGHQTVQTFEGDLDDYRLWLIDKANQLPNHSREKTQSSEKNIAAERRAQRQSEATARNHLAQQRRPLESRIKRIEEQLAKLNAQKTALEQQLADANIYQVQQKDRLNQILIDQAYLAKEIGQLEEEWLEKHQGLEQLAATTEAG